MAGEDARMQPEFSLGERMARIEAEVVCLQQEADFERREKQGQMDRRLMEHAALADEKLKGLSERLTAINNAQAAAVDKAEQASNARFDTFLQQNERKAEVTQTRLAALERGESKGSGEKEAIVSLQNRQIALVGAIVTVVVIILQYHP